MEPLTSAEAVVRHTTSEGNVMGLAFCPTTSLIAFTCSNGSVSRWTNPVPSDLPDPVVTEAAQAKMLERLLDDDFGDDAGEDLEDQGEDLDDAMNGGDDWIVDDDGEYAGEDGEKHRGGRTEVGTYGDCRVFKCH